MPNATTTRDPITGRPALVFWHADARGRGCAVCLAPQAATAENDGALVLSLAPQSGPLPDPVATVGEAAETADERRARLFDFSRALRVRLSPLEVAELLAVVGGQSSVLTHGGTEGIHHNAPDRTASLGFKRSEDPNRPGFLLQLSEIPKADPNARRFASFAFWPAEALLVRHALVGYLPRLCFGE